MAKHFGLNLEDGQFNTLLTISNQHIYFIMDNCHMIKLMKNALFQQEVFYDSNGQEINVKYIKLLHELQHTERLHLANKLTKCHLNWESQVMKVKLAVQTLSAIIADAIDFCRETLKLPQFAHSETTTHFIRFCDRLFNVCNSRNLLGRNFKAPLKTNNTHVWKPFLEEAFLYFKSIKLKDGKLASESRRKTSFLGFLIMIRSFTNMFAEYVECETPKLKYILTYKVSQDHLELFFSSIRSKDGFNNNPTAKQFVAVYKRLLVHHELVHTKSNCLAVDSTSVLNVTSSLSKKTVNIVTHEEIINRYRLFESEEVDHDYLPNLCNISNYVENVIEYISGFVVRKLQCKINCTKCLEALSVSSASKDSLITTKTNGKLIYPSHDVLKICKSAEVICKRVLRETQNVPPKMKNILQDLTNVVFCDVYSEVFENLKYHILNVEFSINHIIPLIKEIASTYINIRLHHINKLYNINLKGASVRSKLNKIVLFKHQ